MLEVIIQNISNTDVNVVVQYTDGEVKLIDGIGHESHSLMKKTSPKKFLFWIENAINTTLYLENIIGQYIIYGKYISHRQFLIQKRDNSKKLYPSESDN